MELWGPGSSSSTVSTPTAPGRATPTLTAPGPPSPPPEKHLADSPTAELFPLGPGDLELNRHQGCVFSWLPPPTLQLQGLRVLGGAPGRGCEVCLKALALRPLHPPPSGFIHEDHLRELLTTMGDRFTDEEVDEMYREAPIDKKGNFNYVEFTRILKHGAKDKDD